MVHIPWPLTDYKQHKEQEATDRCLFVFAEEPASHPAVHHTGSPGLAFNTVKVTE